MHRLLVPVGHGGSPWKEETIPLDSVCPSLSSVPGAVCLLTLTLMCRAVL